MHLAIMKFVKIWPGGTFLDLFFFFASKPNYTFSSVYLCTQACTDTGGGSGQLVAYINLRHVGAIRT